MHVKKRSRDGNAAMQDVLKRHWTSLLTLAHRLLGCPWKRISQRVSAPHCPISRNHSPIIFGERSGKIDEEIFIQSR